MNLQNRLAPDYVLLIECLRDPAKLGRLSAATLSRLLDAAAHARLLGWLICQLKPRQLPAAAPEWLRDRLLTADAICDEYERSVRWEINRLRRAFHDQQIHWVLLKGAAYIAAGLPPGRGRQLADVDILVPRAALDRVELLLGEHGWKVGSISAYDSKYYREWMHELPPMQHDERHSTLDVHHAILPTTGRLKPLSDRLLAHAVTLDGGAGCVLSPAHMVLHSAVHLFQDGEIAGALRDLVDLDSLLRTFGSQTGFWERLTGEARELGVTRPVFYALRYSHQWFGTPIPEDVAGVVRTWMPSRGVLAVMDALVLRTLPDPAHAPSRSAALALYARSHWLRMPPLMLVRHLLRKSMARQN